MEHLNNVSISEGAIANLIYRVLIGWNAIDGRDRFISLTVAKPKLLNSATLWENNLLKRRLASRWVVTLPCKAG